MKKMLRDNLYKMIGAVLLAIFSSFVTYIAIDHQAKKTTARVEAKTLDERVYAVEGELELNVLADELFRREVREDLKEIKKKQDQQYDLLSDLHSRTDKDSTKTPSRPHHVTSDGVVVFYEI